MSGLRIVVLGYVVRMPLGGMSWHYLHYVLAARQLGLEVAFLEDSGDDPWSCYDPRTGVSGRDPSYGLWYAAQVFDRLGLQDCWAYYEAHQKRWHGPLAHRAEDISVEADLALNVSGANAIRHGLEDVPVRVLVDTDPLFSQIRALTDPRRAETMAKHNRYFSFGINLTRGASSVPSDGIEWLPTTQPVVLDQWPAMPGRPSAAITTVMQWDSYASRELDGRTYGMKALSFEPYLDLPLATAEKLELAVGSPDAPRARMQEGGWRLQNPIEVTRHPWTYQDYIQASKAELSVAKHGYVASRSGWFSERSANYLASGRPVIAQDTGFTDWMETGTGVIPFSTPNEALAALDDLNDRYEEHCLAARTMAEEYFEARKILGDLIDRATAE